MTHPGRFGNRIQVDLGPPNPNNAGVWDYTAWFETEGWLRWRLSFLALWEDVDPDQLLCTPPRPKRRWTHHETALGARLDLDPESWAALEDPAPGYVAAFRQWQADYLVWEIEQEQLYPSDSRRGMNEPPQPQNLVKTLQPRYAVRSFGLAENYDAVMTWVDSSVVVRDDGHWVSYRQTVQLVDGGGFHHMVRAAQVMWLLEHGSTTTQYTFRETCGFTNCIHPNHLRARSR